MLAKANIKKMIPIADVGILFMQVLALANIIDLTSNTLKEVVYIKKIAIYGKGGIGKSTTTSNLSAALSKKGCKVMQIGCDPKADSTRILMGGKNVPTILDKIKSHKEDIKLEDVIYEGFNGVLCVEAGGPTPGIGCAGRGIITAFELLEKLKAYDHYKPDIVLYDVLGDVVCGGFAMPIRGGYAEDVYIVSSGEMMSLYAANNISQAVKNFKKLGYAELKGIILNAKNIPDEKDLVQKVAQEIGTEIVKYIPRSEYIQKSENMGQTVVEAFPDSEMSDTYKKLADIIVGNKK